VAFICTSHLLFSICKTTTGNTVGRSILTLAALDSHKHDDEPELKVSGGPPLWNRTLWCLDLSESILFWGALS
jgi:hypothetical protein